MSSQPSYRHLAILVRYGDGNFVRHASIDEVIKKHAVDWLRFNAFTWFVWTEQNELQWYELLKPVFNTKDQILIFRIDASHRYGWAPQWIWDWMDRRNR